MSRALRRTTRAFTSLVRPDLAAALARQSITSPTSIQREALAERSMAVDSRRVEGGAAAVPSPIPAMGAEFGWADPHRCIPRVPETEPKRRKPRTAAEIHQGLVD